MPTRQLPIPPKKDFIQGATLQQEYIFPVTDIEMSRWERDRRQYSRFIPEVVKRFEGIIPTTAPTYEFFPNQPDLARFNAQANKQRFIVDAARVLDGATVQQGYIFPVSQPELNGFQKILQAIRQSPQAPKYTEGATVMPSYEFFPNQPDQARFDMVRQSGRNMPQAVSYSEGSTLQQTYIFPPNQPDLPRYQAKDMLRFIVNSIPRFDGLSPIKTLGLLVGVQRTTHIGTGTAKRTK